MPTHAPSIGFIGTGRLAAALAAGLQSAGYTVTHVAGRNAESANVLASFLGPETAAVASSAEVAVACDVIFLTVPDAAIDSVCASVAWEPRHHVLHCSGATDLGVLEPVTRAGGVAGCLHPLQTFPSRVPQPERFAGVYCGVEGAASPGFNPEQAVSALGTTAFRLEGIDRTAYHAAAVFMSNHVIALASAATRTWVAAGLPLEMARPALAPLLSAAAANVGSMELADALTGPVARGDVPTVEAHLRALSGEPDLLALYRQLSSELLRLPLHHDAEVAAQLASLLAPRPGSE
jgi:predicted short-subunit dehydrogenase-like oxidoreductase (DUF2520 family)